MTALSARYDLKGRTALVTGAGGLLGRQHVAALAEAGARVVVSDIGMAQADATIAAIKEIAPAADLVAAVIDVTSQASVGAADRGPCQPRHRRRHPRQQRRDRSQGHLHARRHAFVALQQTNRTKQEEKKRIALCETLKRW